jgi:selenocysteine lyase/cysteine desulfurase
LQSDLPKRGFQPLTPTESQASFVAFAYENAAQRLGDRLKRANIVVSLYEHRIRIAPSVYNDEEDIERLITALSAIAAA